MRTALAALVALAACRADAPIAGKDAALSADTGGGAGADSGGGVGGSDADASDTGEAGDSGAEDPKDYAALRCLDFESGTLEDAGYTGSFVELWDGALVLVAEEGVTQYSALRGEDALDYGDRHALVLRSSHDGRVESLEIATTPPFTIEDNDGVAHLWWSQLSEVDADGVRIYADLLDETGTIVASLDVPVETGGFVPGLREDHAPIEGFEEIEHGPGQPGVLVRQVTDVGAFTEQALRLRIYQHTRVENNGFFTLFDDICLGATGAAAPLAWGPPDPTH